MLRSWHQHMTGSSYLINCQPSRDDFRVKQGPPPHFGPKTSHTSQLGVVKCRLLTVAPACTATASFPLLQQVADGNTRRHIAASHRAMCSSQS